MLRLFRWDADLKDQILNMLIINCLIIFYLFFVSRSFFQSSELRSWYYPLLFLKLLYGLSYGLLYTYYYTAENDSVCYHHDGLVFNWYFWHEPLRFFKIMIFNELECPEQRYEFWMFGLDRSFFMSKLISLFYILLTKNYWMVTIYSAMINFWAAYYFSNQIVKSYPSLKYSVVLAFLCLPSIQIWTSGLLKECYGLACIYICIGMYLEDKLKCFYKIFVSLLCIWILYKIKVYYLAFMPFVLMHHLYQRYNRWVVSVVLCTALLVVMCFVQSKWTEIVRILLYSRDVSYYAFAGPQSNLYIGEVTTNVWTLVRQAPEIIFKACFEPRYLVGVSFVKVLEGLSNVFVLGCAVLSLTMAVMYRKRPSLEIYMILGYVSISAFLIGLTVPNLGAMVRLRVFYEPFLVFLASVGPGTWVYTLSKKQDSDAKGGDT